MPVRWPRDLELELGLDDPDDEVALREAVARRLGLAARDIPELRLLKRSLDARHGRVRFRLLVRVLSEGGPENRDGPQPREVNHPPRVAIVGDGPAGLFCAYQLARSGVASIVLDRGKRVQPRRRDLKVLQRHGQVDPDSNYCFGEGGAGTYSDGKLYTRSHKRGNVRDVLEILVAHGAAPEVLTEARPHIGSNRLPRIVTAIREHLEAVGVQFRFGARVVDLVRSPRGPIEGLRLADGTVVAADRVVVAAGHSARDVVGWLALHGASIAAKSFAVGVRIEHPQELIDRIQYGRSAGHPRLPPAAYRVSHEVDGRGVFSFCMCPGGFVVPAATEPGCLVINGMSLAKRRFRFANSGLVVGVHPSDAERLGFAGPLGGAALQQRLEQLAFDAGGGGFRAPATRATDFLRRRSSAVVGDTSYIPGLAPTNLYELLALLDPRLAERLRQALVHFEKRMPGYAGESAVLIGVETRTSSPVRIERDPVTLEAIGLPGLYPCGEGAGHAGGIISAAVDGMRVAQSLVTARVG